MTECVIRRWGGRLKVTIYGPDVPVSMSNCPDVTYMLYLVEFKVRIGCTDECDDIEATVERYYIHRWRGTVDDTTCEPVPAQYLMFHEIKNNHEWKLLHVEGGSLTSPDYGPYIPESFLEYCLHDVDGNSMLDQVNYTTLTQSTALAGLFTPITRNRIWNGVMLVCPDGYSEIPTQPCCELSGLPNPPGEVIAKGQALASLYAPLYGGGYVPYLEKLSAVNSFDPCRIIDVTDSWPSFEFEGSVSFSDWGGTAVANIHECDEPGGYCVTGVVFNSPGSYWYEETKMNCDCASSGDCLCTYSVTMFIEHELMGIYNNYTLFSMTVTYPCDCGFTPPFFTAGTIKGPGSTGSFKVIVKTEITGTSGC